jgi:hypothetical protein
VWDAKKEYDNAEEVLKGAGKPYIMTSTVQDLAHQYVFTNISIMQEHHE